MNDYETNYSDMTGINNIMAERLKKCRKNACLSQDEAAYRLVLSRSTYAKYEVGERLPSLDHLMRMAKLFGVKLYDLVSPLENVGNGFFLNEYSPYADYQKPFTTFELNQKFEQLTESEKGYVAKLMDIFIDGH